MVQLFEPFSEPGCLVRKAVLYYINKWLTDEKAINGGNGATPVAWK